MISSLKSGQVRTFKSIAFGADPVGGPEEMDLEVLAFDGEKPHALAAFGDTIFPIGQNADGHWWTVMSTGSRVPLVLVPKVEMMTVLSTYIASRSTPARAEAYAASLFANPDMVQKMRIRSGFPILRFEARGTQVWAIHTEEQPATV